MGLPESKLLGLRSAIKFRLPFLVSVMLAAFYAVGPWRLWRAKK
jgi:hypothetical protein